MIKKRFTFLLTLCLIGSFALTGCGKGDTEKMDAYRDLGISQMQIGEYESAAKSFQKALDQSHGSVGTEELDLCYYKGLAQYESGQYEDAVETYTGLITYEEDNWEPYYLRGNAYLKDGQGKNALTDYNKSLELNGSDFKLYAHIAENLLDSGYDDKADEYLDLALDLDINTPEDYAGAGEIYYLKGDLSNAEICLVQSSSDGYDEAIFLLGRVYVEEDKSDDAIAAFDSYAEMYKDDSAALFKLGKAAMEASCYDNALEYINQAYELADDSNKQEIQRTLVAAYERTANYSAAYDTAEAYLQDYPEDEAMQRELEFLATRSDGTIIAPDEEEEESDDDEDLSN